MELALESYDVCVGLLQSKSKSPDGKQYTINLPNLRVDAAISVEEVCVLASIYVFSFINIFPISLLWGLSESKYLIM